MQRDEAMSATLKGSGGPKLFVSPASFPSFGLWMLLQHFKVRHDVVNVQILDDASRDAFATHYSPLIPSVRTCRVVLFCIRLSC